MNTGQMLLTIGAMILLSAIVLRVNNNFLTTNDVMMDSKFGVLAVSLAQSIIEEANNKAFDEHTDGNPIHDVSLLTSPDSLGEDSEVYPNFNDFDDFNGYKRRDSSMPSAVFDISCRVCYVEPNGSSIVEVYSHPTWHKKIEVTVTSPSMKKADGSLDTIKLAAIYSYWFAR